MWAAFCQQQGLSFYFPELPWALCNLQAVETMSGAWLDALARVAASALVTRGLPPFWPKGLVGPQGGAL